MGCGESKPKADEKAVLPADRKKETVTPVSQATPAPAAPASAPAAPAAPAPVPAAPAAPAVTAPVAPAQVAPAAAAQPGTKTPKPVAIKDQNCDAYGLLLCGAGESGKTTYIRQLKLRYLGGFTEAERKQFISTIRGNLIETIQQLLIFIERHGKSVSDDLKAKANDVADLQAFDCDFTSELADNLKELWEDPEVIEAFKHRDETPIPDHMAYFFGKIDDMINEDYMPTDEDILRARIRTIGIDQVTMDLDGAMIRIYDVGGQKSERAKWDGVMNNVESIIFCVSFAEFDKYMFEQTDTLRIKDSLDIFGRICQTPKFKNSPVFLICNKFDEFEKKVRETDKFITIFPEFNGDKHDPSACGEYLIQQYKNKAVVDGNSRPFVSYKISALDANQVVESANGIFMYISEHCFEK